MLGVSSAMGLSATRIYWLVVGLLLAASVYFTAAVEWRRAQWKGQALEIPSGTDVRVLRIVDGDEVVVEFEDQLVTVRILGIKCFDAKSNDPILAGAGQGCQSALIGQVRNQTVGVVYDELKFDKNKRILAYLRRGEVDVGAQLVSDGHALVYTRYPFSREKEYLAAQAKARAASAGLWANSKVVLRATALDATWRAQREDQ